MCQVSNSSPARCAIYSRDTAVLQSESAAFHVSHAKIRFSKSHHGPKLRASQNIFAGHYLFGFSKYGHILGKTLPVAAPSAGLAGKPMGAQP
jgi:hypothetical protein